MKYKILFPSGYLIKDINNDNIDVNIVLEDGSVYFSTLFTIKNIERLMIKEDGNFFWASDMLLVKDLSKHCIRDVVGEIVKNDYQENIFGYIGVIAEVYDGKATFEDIIDNTLF